MARRSKSNKNKKVDWQDAPDIKARVDDLVVKLNLHWIRPEDVYCVRSNYSNANAYARIWGMSRIWQEVLGIRAAYCLEVLSEKFDHLDKRRRDEILMHELAHIPKNFSGALLAHTKSKGGFHDKLKEMEAAYKKIS